VTGDLDLKELLEFAAEGEPPPVQGPAGVFRRADAIRRRRRMATCLAGVATVGVLVAAGVTVAGRTTGGPGPDGNGPALPASTGGTAPSATPVAPSVMAPVSLLHTLRALLPSGSKTSKPVDDTYMAQVVITDGGGRTLVEIDVQPGYLSSDQKTPQSDLLAKFTCATRDMAAGAQCSAETLPDQTRIVSVTGPADEPKAPAVRLRQVDLLTPGGGRVVATAWNAENPSRGPVTRPEPALGLPQLRAIATSGRWWAG
jgi:hypothetical protein